MPTVARPAIPPASDSDKDGLIGSAAIIQIPMSTKNTPNVFNVVSFVCVVGQGMPAPHVVVRGII